jgi:hypothetical protein
VTELAGRRFDHDRRIGSKGAPQPFTDEARALGIDVDDPRASAWMQEHLPEYRQQASGQRPMYWILGIGFVVGLAAQIGGDLLRPSPPTEPLGLLADLLYALGWALWTGVVVVVFVQIWPEAKRRQLQRSLDAYEAARREQAQAGGDQAAGTTEPRRRGSGRQNSVRGVPAHLTSSPSSCPTPIMTSNRARRCQAPLWVRRRGAGRR